jgi:tetrahydromethanopterin S-methyltransferase subunit A
MCRKIKNAVYLKIGEIFMEWPLTSGSYVVGDSNSPVAVVTLASENLTDDLENYAICGTCFTENFGIEKVIVNVLGNANISTLIVCGEESLHFCGQSIMALYEKGVWDTGGFRKIVGSRAVLPYLNEIPLRAINRFIREIKVVDLVGTTDPTVIQESIDSCRASSRSEASVVSMPEIDEDSWRKYESLVTQSMISHLKK